MAQPIHHPISHPVWCDPRVCEQTCDPARPLHGGTPVTYRLQTSDASLNAHLVQPDDDVVVLFGERPEVFCWLDIVGDDPAMAAFRAIGVTTDVWLDSNDLRIVAAVLTGFADKIDGMSR